MTAHDNNTGAAVSRKRLRYLPLEELVPGMVLGTPLGISDRNILRFTLPAGHELTEDNLRQLSAHGGVIVCIATPDTRSDDEIAAQALAAEHRLREIFAPADLAQPELHKLFECVLAYRTL